MFAVVEIAGKQYIAEPGTKIVVDHVAGDEGTTITLDRVLLVSDGKNVTVGTPTVDGKNVTAKIEKQSKGEKIDVRRYKQKVRSRRHIGFRALETELSIVSVG